MYPDKNSRCSKAKGKSDFRDASQDAVATTGDRRSERCAGGAYDLRGTKKALLITAAKQIPAIPKTKAACQGRCRT